MAKLPFLVAIISLLIVGCTGSTRMRMGWTPELEMQLLDIFYGTYPDDDRHMQRVKQEWDDQVPNHVGLSADQLEDRVKDLQERHWYQWKKHPPIERECLENVLIRTYGVVREYPKDQERHLFNLFLQRCPQYVGEARLMRTIVYRWHKLYTPLGKEIHAKDVDWTPQRETYLRNIVEQLPEKVVHKTCVVKQLWVAKYTHLNVDEFSLMRHVYNNRRDKLRLEREELHQTMQGNRSLLASEEDTMQEEGIVLKGKRSKWKPQMIADLLCIMNKLHGLNVSQAAAIKDRWDRMQKKYTYLKGESLLAHANRLKELEYTPDLKNILKAEEKYAELPPLRQEEFLKRQGTRKSQPLRISEGHQPSQQHQDKPASPGMEVTPELLMMLEHGVAGMNASYSEHAHYPNQTDYHGSSKHNPIDQRQLTSLPDTPHPHHQFWNPVGSSSHTSIHGDPFGLLTNASHSHQHFWGPGSSSSHTPIQPGPFGSLPHTPYPHQDFWSQGGSSSHNSSQSHPFDSLSHISYPHPDSWSSGSSSSYNPIQEDASGLIVVASRPQQRQQDPRGSSSRTSIHEGPSAPIAETSGQRRRREDTTYPSIHVDESGFIAVAQRPRILPRDHRGRGNRTSVHEESSQQHVDTPRPYSHHFPPGRGRRHRHNPPQ